MTEAKWQTLRTEAATAARQARELAEKAQHEGREFTTAESKRFDDLYAESTEKSARSDRAKAEQDQHDRVFASLPTADRAARGEPVDAGPGSLGLSGKAAHTLAGHIAGGMLAGSQGVKALTPSGETVQSVPVISGVLQDGQPATSLLDLLGTQQRNPVYRYLRQTTRDNQAAIVAPGGLKPTSVYETETITAELQVFAHLSDPVDHYLLSDVPALQQFVSSEMVYGLRVALEDEVLNGDGTSGHLSGILATSGVQTQAFGDDKITTLRSAATKLETLGYEASGYVLHPNDWEDIESTRNTSGAFDLAASGSPVDRAARRVWGVPVAISTQLTEGTALALDAGALSVDTDGAGLATQWSNSTGDDFSRNQIRARTEGRFGLAVYRPAAIVNVSLAAA